MKLIDWNKVSEKRKQEISKLKPVFVVGSRGISENRITDLSSQLSKSKKPILWGVLKDDYILGLEGCPQFRTNYHRRDAINRVSTVNHVSSYTLEYFQRDLKYILKELDFSAVIFINGSWYKMLHTLPEIWEVINKKTPYKLVSPFVDETEAKEYVEKLAPEIAKLGMYEKDKVYSDEEIFQIVDSVAKKSYITDFQTASALVKNGKILLTAYNNVVPYETYAMHNGLMKEKYFDPPNDLNHFDTNHSEVDLILQAQKQKLDITGSTLYINLMPCPICAKMICRSDISEVVYKLDHSDGYAFNLLTAAGKKIRRI
jgi:dCMP deaminase